MGDAARRGASALSWRRTADGDARRTRRGGGVNGLRFCMVTTFYPPYSFGGDAIGVQRLSRALVRRGHDVTVVHDTDAFRVLHRGPVQERPDSTTTKA